MQTAELVQVLKISGLHWLLYVKMIKEWFRNAMFSLLQSILNVTVL